MKCEDTHREKQNPQRCTNQPQTLLPLLRQPISPWHSHSTQETAEGTPKPERTWKEQKVTKESDTGRHYWDSAVQSRKGTGIWITEFGFKPRLCLFRAFWSWAREPPYLFLSSSVKYWHSSYSLFVRITLEKALQLWKHWAQKAHSHFEINKSRV